jgi:predicted enzyme related to lactoylglutathione lyase
MSTLPPGTPNWVDLSTPDLDAAKRFYAALFGWTAHVAPQPEAGGYTIFTLGAKAVAGAGPLFTEGQPPAWSTYIAADDADAVAGRVEASGGKVLVKPFDVLDQGRMGVFLDPAGAAFSVWQPMAMPGAELYNEPGSWSWNELTTTDPDGAKAFYDSVFGWKADDMPMGPGTYSVWKLDDRPIGGMMPMLGADRPTDLPPHWMVYFSVADADATATRAAELGGAVCVAPSDLSQGRFAVLNDPQGAVFAVIKFNSTQ